MTVLQQAVILVHCGPRFPNDAAQCTFGEFLQCVPVFVRDFLDIAYSSIDFPCLLEDFFG
jgi:hypothetical protein